MSKVINITRHSLAVMLVLILISKGAASAQQAPSQNRDFTKGAPIFPNVLAPYKSHDIPEPNLINSVRISGLIQNGNLMLSLDDAIALALENNLDLVIARYNLPIADTDILRTKSGANDRGVNTGIVQGTPGAGNGGNGSGDACSACAKARSKGWCARKDLIFQASDSLLWRLII